MRARSARWIGSVASAALVCAVACSLTNDLDELKGPTADAGTDTSSANCVPGGDCSSCATCVSYCGCTRAEPLASCVSQCEGSGGSSGSSGGGGSGGSGGSGGLGAASGSSGLGGTGGDGASGGQGGAMGGSGGTINCSGSACQDCCSNAYPSGYQAYAIALEHCMCATGGECTQACSIFCVQQQQPDQACIDCVQTSASVSQCFSMECQDGDCVAFATCLQQC